ncbi:MAG: DUF885 domain-containing protein, partial [Bacteroidota bacterium]|nr:DUF885 domain-containing protein [Bacteroidota bacterium]
IGDRRYDNRWDNISDQQKKIDKEINELELKVLAKIDRNELDKQDKLSYDLFEYDKKQELKKYEFRFNTWPINTQEGIHTFIPSFLASSHLIETEMDAVNYIKRIEKVKPLFDTLINEQLAIREKLKIRPAKFVYQKVIKACQNIITGYPFTPHNKSPIWDDFTEKLSKTKFSNVKKDSLMKSCSLALINFVKPSYELLINKLTEQEKKSDTTVGAWNFPSGDAFYKLMVQDYTTTNMTPDQVFDFGTKEVARIHTEIKVIMTKLGYKGSIQSFFQYMTSPENKNSFYPNSQEGKDKYLKGATKYVDEMRTKLDALFLTKPKAEIIVMQVEKYRESSAGTAFYEHPSLDGKIPGRFYVNLFDMNQSPVYQLEALSYHEGIPGHHMQISINQELQNIPEFRKFSSYTAYIEGWGLYSEYIPKEIGFYQDTYSDFGRLSMELLRAARCVVDPGIHYKHWNRNQAIQYFINNTAEPAGECVNAIERYITWPGQATAYMVGKDKILALRKKAEVELGTNFDIRKFHDVVLINGALPLNKLEELVNDYIKENKKG